MKCFNWPEAARLIRAYQTLYPERDCTVVAGLYEDWFSTADTIYENGAPKLDTCAYLVSNWATPVLEIDRRRYDCFISDGIESDRWPQEALDILEGKSA